MNTTEHMETPKPTFVTSFETPSTAGDERDFHYSRSVVRDATTASPKVVREDRVIRFRVAKRPERVGLLLIGYTGNNGTTLTVGLLANRHKCTWKDRTGVKHANYYGSVTQCGSVRLGVDAETGLNVFCPLKSLVSMVDPENLVVSGWDINSMDIYHATERAHVYEPQMYDQYADELSCLKPMPGVYFPAFISPNLAPRANNTIKADENVTRYAEIVETLRENIRTFKHDNNLDKVIVLWTASTECYCELDPKVNASDDADVWLNYLRDNCYTANNNMVSPSSMYATAAILEGCIYLNGSPQNTFTPAIVALARKNATFIAGDDFKSGQTKMKSVLSEFLIGAGIRLASVASYNHLGNSDGHNLASPMQFRSKEISKASVIDDMINSNAILYPPGKCVDDGCGNMSPQDKIDHIVVIKYVPFVGDSKRALDEYTSEIFMNGRNTISMANVCEDSLLAAPIMMDIVIVAELLSRIQYCMVSDNETEFHNFDSVMSQLSYFFKAPLGINRNRSDVVNALGQQRMNLENFLRAIAGIPLETYFDIEKRMH